jgi:hypothetical protein
MAPRCPHIETRRHEKLHPRVRQHDRADVPPIQHRALGREAALKGEERRSHTRHRGDLRGGGIRHGAAKIAALQVGGLKRLGGQGRGRWVGRVRAGIQHAPADGAV